MDEDSKDLRRATVYVTSERLIEIKVAAAHAGMTVSGWINQAIDAELKKAEEKNK